MLGAMIAFTSCAKDNLSTQSEQESELYSLSVSAETNVGTRAVLQEPEAEIDGNKLRYILEIYHNDLLFQRIVQNEKVFNFRLVTNQNYDFLVWVDYAPEVVGGATNDLHYVTANGLKQITMQGDYTNNDHCRDAFFAARKGVPSGNTANAFENIVCKRPFGQLNIATTDWNHTFGADGNPISSLTPEKVQITFNAHNAFNVYAEDVVEDAKADFIYVATQGMVGQDIQDPNKYHLTCDYIFAPKANVLVNPRVDFYAVGATSPFTNTGDMLLNIPIQRNYKTNVYGNLLTKKGQVTIDVEAEWETPAIIVPVNLEDFQAELDKLDANSPENVYFNIAGDGGKAPNGLNQLVYELPATLGSQIKGIHITFVDGIKNAKFGFTSKVPYSGVLVVESKVKHDGSFALQINGSNLKDCDFQVKGFWGQVMPGTVQKVTVLASAEVGQLNCQRGDNTKTPTWLVKNFGTIDNLRMPVAGNHVMHCYNNGVITRDTDVATTNVIEYK